MFRPNLPRVEKFKNIHAFPRREPPKQITYDVEPAPVIKYVDRIVDKIVEKPVERIVYVDRIVEKPVERTVERPVERVGDVEDLQKKIVIYEKFIDEIEEKLEKMYNDYKGGEKRREQQREYYKKNREKILEKRQTARAVKRTPTLAIDPNVSAMVDMLERFKEETMKCDGNRERLNELKRAIKYAVSLPVEE